MNQLKENIVATYGAKGEHWIEGLPAILKTLADHYKLNHLSLVDNMSFNYVVKAVTNTGQPVVLKIGYDEKAVADENDALLYFNGKGAIQVIDYHKTHHALLLQQASPGVTLSSFYSSQKEYVMDCYISVVKNLHQKPLPEKFKNRHIADWLTILDHFSSDQLPSHLLRRAIELKNTLLASMGPLVFLHGDLHHDNILKNGDEWLAIDPKGVIGESEFEVAAFDFMYVSELSNQSDVKSSFESRIKRLAEKSHLDPQRIKDWVFVRLILMAAWSIEDNHAPDKAIKLAEALF